MNKLYSTVRKGFIAAATIGFMAIFAPVQAAPVVVNFSFSDGDTEVTGTIFGLDDNLATPQAATSVSASASFWGPLPLEFLDSPTVTVNNNSFTFTAGSLSSFYFGGFDFPLGLLLVFNPGASAQGYAENDFLDINTGVSLVTTSLSSPPVSAVPLPPAGVLFGSGLVVLAAMRRRAKKQATA